MIELIEQAIRGRNLITFRYDNENRLVEPHAVGRTAKGKSVVRGFQPAGGTSRELGWKLFSLDKIEDFQCLRLTFSEARDGYKPDDKQIPDMAAQV